MKQYPTIPKEPDKGPNKFWVFDKYDGSNIRSEWSKKRGFHKFGTRKRLLGTDQGLLFLAQDLIKNQESEFAKIFKKAKYDRVVCFFEFWGSKSFAGNHVADDEHQVTLLDIDVYKQGLIPPDDFVKLFNNASIDSAELLHCGSVDEKLKQQVRRGEFPGMTYEGVVCKARPNKRFNKPNMFKIKSDAWISRVKANFDQSKWEDLL